MSTLPETTLTWLKHAAQAGQRDAQVLLHLIARVDAQDQWFTKFTDHYSKTIANLCRKLEALERRANDLPTPAAPVDDSPVANALLVAESALADVAKGMAVSLRAHYRLDVANAQCTRALAAIRPAMKEHGIGTSEFPPAAPAPAAPTPSPTALVEVVGNELPLPPAPEDLATDQMMAANLSALLIKECGLHSPESSAHDLLQRAAAMLVNYGLPARSAILPALEPGEVGELVEMLTQDAAILEAHCNKIANGECRNLACLQRGGYIRGTESPDSSIATCPELEKAVAKRRAATLLQQQEAKLATLRAAPVAVSELDDQRREAVCQAVAEALGTAYDCQRVWEAWGVGTMGPDDFVPVAEDSDRVAEIADAAIEAIRAMPAPQAWEVGA